MIEYYNRDCLEAMKEYPDNHFNLAIVDPPYGDPIVLNGESRFGGRWNKYKRAKTGGGYYKKYGKKQIGWDVAPPPEYFEQLFRVSKNQIIWGGNYFRLPPSRNFVIWRKLTISDNFSMAMAEFAWTNIRGNAKVFEAAPQGTADEPRFHPTQKPIALYKWLLKNYANQGDLILDTHVGSASSLVACYEMGFSAIGFEIDEEYYKKSKDRLEAAMSQPRLEDKPQKLWQVSLFTEDEQ